MASYEEFIGEIPYRKTVQHICDEPRCINPEHLYLGGEFQKRRNKGWYR